MIHKKNEEINVYECSISDKADNWMCRLHFNVLFLDRNNPNLLISARMSWLIEVMKPLTVKKKKIAVVVFKPDNTLLLVFKRYVKREFKKLLNIILETLTMTLILDLRDIWYYITFYFNHTRLFNGHKSRYSLSLSLNVSSHQFYSKIIAQFSYLSLYLGTETNPLWIILRFWETAHLPLP